MNKEDDLERELDKAITDVAESLAAFLSQRNATVTKLELDGLSEKVLRIELRTWSNPNAVSLYSALTQFEALKYRSRMSQGNYTSGGRTGYWFGGA